MNNIVRRVALRRSLFLGSLCGALLALAPISAAFSQAAPAAQDTAEATACTCTCEVCLAKHGPKAKPTAAWKLELSVGTAASSQGVRVAAPKASQERGYLGVFLGGSGDGDGAVVANVVDGAAAGRAGMKTGDLIVVAEELPITSAQDLLGALSDLKVGDVATFEVERGDDELKFSVTLGARPSVDGAENTQLRQITFAPQKPAKPAKASKPSKPAKPAKASKGKRQMRSDFFLGRGEADAQSVTAMPTATVEKLLSARDEADAMRKQIRVLEKQVAELRKVVEQMQAELKRRR